jgi:hypothetical protein
MQVAPRDYYCPLCGNPELHTTNHQGEIYTPCKKCGHGVLYCAEVDAHAGLPFVTATLHFYHFNFDAPPYGGGDAAKAEYKALRGSLIAAGCKKFATLGHKHEESNQFRYRDGLPVKLFNPGQWPDQFVSDIGRLHRWFEFVWPNKKIKTGYWLEVH